MTDEEVRRARRRAPLEVPEQVEDLRPHRDVERRNGLVEHHEPGPRREGARDRDALPLPAGELARQPREGRGGKLHRGDEGGRARAPLGPGPDSMNRERLGDDLPDGQPRIERRRGILEDDADVPAPAVQLPGRKGEPVGPVEEHRAPVGRGEAQDDARRGRLAGARLPHERERGAGGEIEADAVEGGHRAGPRRERLVEVTDRKERSGRTRAHGTRASGAPSRRKHAASVPAPAGTRIGRAAAHRPNASPQRGSNAQPGGLLPGSGTAPRRAAETRGIRRRGPRTRAEESARVGMPGAREELTHRRALHDLARVHDENAVRGLRHDAEVVGDEKNGERELVPELEKKVEHLRLHGDVERRRRLVGDEKARAAGEGEGEERALAHPAGELVGKRVPLSPGIGKRHALEPALGLDGRRFSRQAAMPFDHVRQLPADRPHRVERGGRLLEDEPDPAAAQTLLFARGKRPHVAAREEDVSGDQAHRRRHEVHERERRQRLAASRLADEGDDLAGFDVEGNPVHRRDLTSGRARHRDREGTDRKERGGGAGHGGSQESRPRLKRAQAP